MGHGADSLFVDLGRNGCLFWSPRCQHIWQAGRVDPIGNRAARPGVSNTNQGPGNMFDQLSDAMTELEQNDDAWVGVLSFAGKHTTAGLDLPRFAGSMRDGSRDAAEDDRVDAFALRRRCAKPA